MGSKKARMRPEYVQHSIVNTDTEKLSAMGRRGAEVQKARRAEVRGILLKGLEAKQVRPLPPEAGSPAEAEKIIKERGDESYDPNS